MSKTEDDDPTLESVHRVLTLLRALAYFGNSWFGVTQLAERWKQPKSTTHRYLQALLKEGIVEYDEDMRKYHVKK